MPLTARAAAVKLVSRYPVYRIAPPSALRDFAAVKYHGRGSWEDLARFVRAHGVPDRHLPSAMAATRAAFRAGDDELVTETLTRLENRYPQAAAVHELWCDLHDFHGDQEAAWHSAERARSLHPRSVPALVRLIRLNYRIRDRATADKFAVEAVQQKPNLVPVLSTICKELDTAEQFQQIHRTWQEAAHRPTDLVKVVRQLANGALRTGQTETAAALYREAIGMIAAGEAKAHRIRTPSLAGRGAWSAIEDLCQALDPTGAPYFFAAGTALGLVRQGRPLGHDDDIDVGVLAAGWERDRLVAALGAHPRFTLLHNPQTDKIGVEHRAGSRVDIFRFYPEDGRIWHSGVFVRWHNTPFALARKELHGLQVPLPADEDRYLTENYGDWRTPNPNFDAFTDDAPNVEVTWPEYLRVHFIRRAYRRLVGRDTAAAAEDLRRAGEAELAARIEDGPPSRQRDHRAVGNLEYGDEPPASETTPPGQEAEVR